MSKNKKNCESSSSPGNGSDSKESGAAAAAAEAAHRRPPAASLPPSPMNALLGFLNERMKKTVPVISLTSLFCFLEKLSSKVLLLSR